MRLIWLPVSVCIVASAISAVIVKPDHFWSLFLIGVPFAMVWQMLLLCLGMCTGPVSLIKEMCLRY